MGGGAAAGGSSSSAASIELLHARPRPAAAAPTNIVHVLTSDGEYFPVKKKLLRPCIALTKVGVLHVTAVVCEGRGQAHRACHTMGVGVTAGVGARGGV